MTHYRLLGVEPTATPAEVQTAYRRAARAHHPDTQGDSSADRMAEVNEAWRVLRDPELRRQYDRTLAEARPTPAQPTDAMPNAEAAADVRSVQYEPARFPWRFMAVMAVIGVTIVVVGRATYEPPDPVPPDRVIGSGSCVVFQPNGDAAEVDCAQPNDGVVSTIVPFDDTCPGDTEPHRDQQGLGLACVKVP